MRKTTNFNISFDNFPRFAHQKVNFLERDIAHFIKYGYSLETAGALDKRISNYEEIPTDEEREGDLMIATEKKNGCALLVQSKIRNMMLSIQNKFGKNSPYYKKFRASSLSQLTDEMLLRTAKRVVRVTSVQVSDLKVSGLTTPDVDELKQLIADFEVAMETQDDAISEREIGTLSRVDEANKIYKQIAKFCETGKGIWKSSNEAKYNDYVIYDTPSGQSENGEDKHKHGHH